MKKFILLIIEKIRKALKVDENGNSFWWRKGILLITVLMMIGCDIVIGSLDVVNGTKYVVKAKRVNRNNYGYIYNLVEADTWYNYTYIDTIDFNVGDTLVITVKRVGN